MSRIFSSIFNRADYVQAQSLTHRQNRGEIIGSNIANHETPGYLALEYSFEEALQEVADVSQKLPMRTSSLNHFQHSQVDAGGGIHNTVTIRPNESVGEDGNTVDVDKEMADLSENNILYRTVVETLNRKLGMIRYAISGGQ